MSRFVLAKRAVRDLEQIYDYIARDNRKAAKTLIGKIRSRFQVLAENPLIGTRFGAIDDRLRMLTVPPYVIFYLPLDDHVEIVRVLHSARDIPQVLWQDKPES